MSDLLWIAFIIILYIVIIKPLFQGVMDAPKSAKQQTKAKEPEQASKPGDYVDYEEIK